MLTFLYTGDYDYSSLEKPAVMPLMLHAKMYTLADKYQIPTLMRHAEYRYKQVLGCSPGLEDYFLSIPDVYAPPASTGRLRVIAVQHARRVLRESIAQENIREHLQQLMIEVPEYGFEVLMVFVNSPLRGTCVNCDDQDAEVTQARCRQCGKGGGMYNTY